MRPQAAAIACFEGAQAIVVPRDRFAPVKTTNGLLMLWSDAYEVTIDSRMVLAEQESRRDLVIDLDTRFYGTVDKLAERFAEAPPSLAKCRRLRVVGDHSFGAGVVFEGEAQLVNEASEQVHVPDGSVIGNN